ncbi:MAG: trypsin-like peptidase domain-containing protein [Nitrospira sp.]
MIPLSSPYRRRYRRLWRTCGIIGLILWASLGQSGPPVQAGAPSTPDEVNNVRIYKSVAKSTVLITSVYHSPHPATRASWKGLGSGVLIDEQGSIVTNAHVVGETTKITVTLHDGRRLPAELIGSDPLTDVALIQVTLPKGAASPAHMADSDKLEIGQKVLAIGHPFGLGYSFSIGIVSGFGRMMETTQDALQRAIQTTAPINPGNSGGPLVDSDGRVVGINSTILLEAQNISFAIPSNTVKSIVAELRATGRVIRPWLGVKGRLVTDELRNLIALPLVEGLLVLDVDEGSPADKAGLRGGKLDVVIEGDPWVLGGDIIVAINEQPVRTHEQLTKLFHQLKAEQPVDLRIVRDGEFSTRTLALGERPSPQRQHPNRDVLPLVSQGMAFVPF